MKKLKKEKLLILDERLLYPFKKAEARDVPLSSAPSMIPASGTRTCTAPLADAICDRIIYNAYTIQIEGKSMRKGIPE